MAREQAGKTGKWALHNIMVSPKMDGKFHFTLTTDPNNMNGTQFNPTTGAKLEFTREAITPKTDVAQAFVIGEGTKFGSWNFTTTGASSYKYHLYRDSSLSEFGYSTFVNLAYGDQFKVSNGTGWDQSGKLYLNRSQGIWDTSDWNEWPDKTKDDNLVYQGSGGWYRIEMYYNVRGGTSGNVHTDFNDAGSKTFLRIYKV